MEEIWLDVIGFEGYYQISNFGRTKSFLKEEKGRILKDTNAKGGYFSRVLKINKNNGLIEIKSKRVHVLVAEHFIGSRPKGYHIHHKDGNKQNNRADNLEYISPIEHSILECSLNPSRITGMVNYNRFVRPTPIIQLSISGKFITIYPNAKEAGRKTGVCSRNIHQVASKTQYKPGRIRSQAGGYKWKYKEKQL